MGMRAWVSRLVAAPSQVSRGSQSRLASDMALRGVSAWFTPRARARPSVKASSWRWHEAQDTVLFTDSAVFIEQLPAQRHAFHREGVVGGLRGQRGEIAGYFQVVGRGRYSPARWARPRPASRSWPQPSGKAASSSTCFSNDFISSSKVTGPASNGTTGQATSPRPEANRTRTQRAGKKVPAPPRS